MFVIINENNDKLKDLQIFVKKNIGCGNEASAPVYVNPNLPSAI